MTTTPVATAARVTVTRGQWLNALAATSVAVKAGRFAHVRLVGGADGVHLTTFFGGMHVTMRVAAECGQTFDVLVAHKALLTAMRGTAPSNSKASQALPVTLAVSTDVVEVFVGDALHGAVTIDRIGSMQPIGAVGELVAKLDSTNLRAALKAVSYAAEHDILSTMVFRHVAMLSDGSHVELQATDRYRLARCLQVSALGPVERFQALLPVRPFEKLLRHLTAETTLVYSADKVTTLTCGELTITLDQQTELWPSLTHLINHRGGWVELSRDALLDVTGQVISRVEGCGFRNEPMVLRLAAEGTSTASISGDHPAAGRQEFSFSLTMLDRGDLESVGGVEDGIATVGLNPYYVQQTLKAMTGDRVRIVLVRTTKAPVLLVDPSSPEPVCEHVLMTMRLRSK